MSSVKKTLHLLIAVWLTLWLPIANAIMAVTPFCEPAPRAPFHHVSSSMDKDHGKGVTSIESQPLSDHLPDNHYHCGTCSIGFCHAIFGALVTPIHRWVMPIQSDLLIEYLHYSSVVLACPQRPPILSAY